MFLTVEAMIGEMEAAGIDAAVGCWLGQMVGDSCDVEACRRHPEWIFGFVPENLRLPWAVAPGVAKPLPRP